MFIAQGDHGGPLVLSQVGCFLADIALFKLSNISSAAVLNDNKN